MTAMKIQLERIVALILILSLIMIQDLNGQGISAISRILFPLALSAEADSYGNLVENPNVISPSYYIETANFNKLQTLGITVGQQLLAIKSTQDVAIILDFGEPNYDSSTQQYGADLLTRDNFVSWSIIANLVESFISGYYASNQTDFITIIICVNNDNYYAINMTSHGSVWGTSLVAQIVDYIASLNASTHIHAFGGMDIEVKYNSYTDTQYWINGYGIYSTLYNIGAADGCPIEFYGTYPGGPCISGNFTWTQDQVFQVSYGANGNIKPLPEIYNTVEYNARQWESLSYYGSQVHGFRLNIVGSLTEYQACIQQPPCEGIDNNPIVGEQQLYKWLHENVHTGQNFAWSTDISYVYP